MDILKIILIVFGVLVIGVVLLQSLEKKPTIEGFTDIKCVEGEPCPKGCNYPTKILSNCETKIYKEDNGKCYKLCPYECTDPTAECAYNECCENCGKVKVYVNCKTGKANNTGPDLNDPTQKTNHSGSTINTGKTNTSKNDIQGSLVDDETTPPPKPPPKPTLKPTIPPSTEDDQSLPQTIEYHNHYYGLTSPTNTCVKTPMVPNTQTTQKGTPNPYRQGGDISNQLDDQTCTMEKGLSQKQDASTIMNYGAYGTSKTPNTSQTSATGMYNEDTTTPGFNSLYSIKF